MNDTIRIRVAVAVGDDGSWHACGWSDAKAGDARDTAIDCLEPDCRSWRVVWVEAAIPLYQEQTVQGEVADGPE